MNFKSQNPIDASQSERFKLYKSGKLWLVAGLTFFSFLGGSVLGAQSFAFQLINDATLT